MSHTGHRRFKIRSLSVIALCLLFVSGTLTGCTNREMAGRIQGLINEERAANGIHELVWNDNNAEKAQAWAEHMANTRTLQHSSIRSGISGSWATLAENVGYAGSLDEAHANFMQSSSHRTTILRRDLTSVGVGVAERNGIYWVVEVFRG